MSRATKINNYNQHASTASHLVSHSQDLYRPQRSLPPQLHSRPSLPPLPPFQPPPPPFSRSLRPPPPVELPPPAPPPVELPPPPPQPSFPISPGNRPLSLFALLPRQCASHLPPQLMTSTTTVDSHKMPPAREMDTRFRLLSPLKLRQQFGGQNERKDSFNQIYKEKALSSIKISSLAPALQSLKDDSTTISKSNKKISSISKKDDDGMAHTVSTVQHNWFTDTAVRPLEEVLQELSVQSTAFRLVKNRIKSKQQMKEHYHEWKKLRKNKDYVPTCRRSPLHIEPLPQHSASTNGTVRTTAAVVEPELESFMNFIEDDRMYSNFDQFDHLWGQNEGNDASKDDFNFDCLDYELLELSKELSFFAD